MTDDDEIEFERLKIARDSLLITNARLHGEIDRLRKTEEDEEFERIERQQARANGWRKRQLEDEEQKPERCPACNRVWEKDDYAD
jgi:hypothetical protein